VDAYNVTLQVIKLAPQRHTTYTLFCENADTTRVGAALMSQRISL